MSKALARQSSKVRAVGYVYKVPKPIRFYGGGRSCVPALEDEYRKEEYTEIDLTAVYRYGIFPQIRSTALSLKSTCVEPSVAREFWACETSAIQLRNFTNLSITHPAGDHRLWEIGSVKKSWENLFGQHSVDYFGAWLNDFVGEANANATAMALLFSPKSRCRGRFALQEWALSSLPRVLQVEPKADWVHEPEGILHRLENRDAYPDDIEAAVLFAEVKPFRGEQRTRLLKALGKYIDQHRFVEDQDSLVTLCSAIRKYAMNMLESHFEGYANWLLPTETATLHHEAEMEFAKGICWRLEFEPHSWPAEYPLLTKTLFDLVDSYLTPRLILQKSYANTAMFGMVALHVLEAASTTSKALVAKLRKRMMDCGVKWFAEMVDDNVDEAIQYISERDDVLAREVTKIRQG